MCVGIVIDVVLDVGEFVMYVCVCGCEVVVVCVFVVYYDVEYVMVVVCYF